MVALIYSLPALPKPILIVDHAEGLVNTTANVTCKLDGSESPGVEMQITDNHGLIASSKPGSSVIQHQLTAREEDDGREFICIALLRVDGIQVMKNTSLKLTVFCE